MERSKNDDKSIMIVGGGERRVSSLGQLQLLVGKGELQPHTLASFLQQGEDSVCLGVYCRRGEGCNCRGLLCSQSFLRYWRSRCPCAPFHICRSKQFFLSLCWDLISRNKTENTGEKRGISARAFLAFVSSSALIVFRSQYLIFPTSGSQFFLMRQRLSGIILV